MVEKINEEMIEEILEVSSTVNRWFSYISPSVFADRGNFEGVFAKAQYYDSIVDFLKEMFISFQYIHPFYDGNKRTLFHLYIQLISDFTEYEVVNHELLAKSQLAFLEKRINEKGFKVIIEVCLTFKKV